MMPYVTTAIVVLFAILPLNSADLNYVKSSPISCDILQVCHYNYSLEIGHFDKPLSVEASISVQCLSSGHFGEIPATEHCLTIKDIGGNFLNYDDNKTSEYQEYKWKLKSFTLEQLSGEFCYIQTTDGRVVSVRHHQDEEESVVNFKKGIAAAFQTNFNGASDEIEIGTQSRHHSHYSYSDGNYRTGKIHRTITSDDVIEYYGDVDTRDIEFNEEDDMEYSDGILIKASGTIDMSVKRGRQTASRVFSAIHGKFSMLLIECRNASKSRERKSIKPPLNEEQAAKTNLMGTHDKSISDIEVLQGLRKHFESAEKIIETIRDIQNQGEINKLERLLVLERTYGMEGFSATLTIFTYLNQILRLKKEGYEDQRIVIYSLLSSVGSAEAESALIERLESDDILSQKEESAILLAISMLPTPSNRLIINMEKMIVESSDWQSTLLLVYGSLVGNAEVTWQKRMVKFLADRLPEDENGNVIHILHALGNTKSIIALGHIIRYTSNKNNNVIKTAIYALRFFTGLTTVQQQFISILSCEGSETFIEIIIKSIYTGYEYNRSIELDKELIKSLTEVTLKTGDKYLVSELRNLYGMMGFTITVDLVKHTHSQQRRDIAEWDSPSEIYDTIAPVSVREADLRSFPINRGFLWNHTLGLTEGDYKVYVQGTAGLFAGLNLDACDAKIFGRAVIRGHILGEEATILDVLEDNGRFYVEFIGIVIFEVDPMLESYRDFNYTYQLPMFNRQLLSFSFEFFVYGVPIDLELSIHGRIGGELNIEFKQNTDGSIEGIGSLIPSVVMSTEASVTTIAPLIARVGVGVTASVPYEITVLATINVCSLSDSACLNITHGWESIDIVFAAFYQLPSISALGYGEKNTWDSLTFTHSIDGQQWNLYSSCISGSPPSMVYSPLFMAVFTVVIALFLIANST